MDLLYCPTTTTLDITIYSSLLYSANVISTEYLCTFFFFDGEDFELGTLATAPDGCEEGAVATLSWLLLLLGTLSDLRSRMDLWKAIRL